MKLNVIISASPTSSHPSIVQIKQVVESLKHINAKNKYNVILAHDGIADPAKLEKVRSYHEYFKNLENFAKNYHEIAEINEIKIVGADKWGGKILGIREAMKVVNSEYLLMLEHDHPLIRDFKIEDILEDMDLDETIKHIRFGIGGMEPGSGDLIWPLYDGRNDLFGKEKRCKNYTYTRTPFWSEQPHVCKTSYYTDFVFPRWGALDVWGSIERRVNALCPRIHGNLFLQERYGLSWEPSDILTKIGFTGQSPKRGRYWWRGVKGSDLEKIYEDQGTYLFGSLEQFLTGTSGYVLHHCYSVFERPPFRASRWKTPPSPMWGRFGPTR